MCNDVQASRRLSALGEEAWRRDRLLGPAVKHGGDRPPATPGLPKAQHGTLHTRVTLHRQHVHSLLIGLRTRRPCSGAWSAVSPAQRRRTAGGSRPFTPRRGGAGCIV